MSRTPDAAVTELRQAVVRDWNKNRYTQEEIAARHRIRREVVANYIHQARHLGMKVRVGDRGPPGFGAIRVKPAKPLTMRERVEALERRIASLERKVS